MGFIQDLFRNIFRPSVNIPIGSKLIQTTATGGTVINPNEYFNNPFNKFVRIPIITDFISLGSGELNHLLNILNADNMTFEFQNELMVFKVQSPYLGSTFLAKYQPNYQTPYNSIKYVTELLNVPSDVQKFLLEETKGKEGNKNWLKEKLAWLFKYWKEIVAGIITAAQLIKAKQSAEDGTLRSGLLDRFSDNGNDETKYPPNINPETGLPWGEAPGGNGFDLGSFISANAVPLIGIAGAGWYFLSDNKKKKRKR